MKERKLHPVFAIYSAALVWALYGLLLPLYRIPDLLIAIALSFIVYFVAKHVLCKKETNYSVKFERTGIAEADEIIKEGKTFIATLDRQNQNISNTKLSGQIELLKKSAIDIFQFVEKNPTDARMLNTFMEYYFPTTIKLLETYIELQDKGSMEGNISNTIEKIESVMDNICIAFQKQLDVLYEHKSLDVRADIEVLKTILSRENLE